MKHKSNVYREIIAVLGISLLVGEMTPNSRADSLYVGDIGDASSQRGQSTVLRYDAKTGEYQGVFVTSDSPALTRANPLSGCAGSSSTIKVTYSLRTKTTYNQKTERFYATRLYPDHMDQARFLQARSLTLRIQTEHLIQTRRLLLTAFALTTSFSLWPARSQKDRRLLYSASSGPTARKGNSLLNSRLRLMVLGLGSYSTRDRWLSGRTGCLCFQCPKSSSSRRIRLRWPGSALRTQEQEV
jgi:hypothetical protein